MNWYLKYTAYEDHRHYVDQVARGAEYPFAAWFPDGGRVYLEFSPIGQSTESWIDKDIKDLIDGLGYTVTPESYRGGYCFKGKNQIRIGKIINNEWANEKKDAQRKFQAGELYNLEEEIITIDKYYQELSQTFTNSPLRSAKESFQFYIVISQNPHDVASMSTDRDWFSCMDLDDGAQREDVYKEIKVGSLVAYLVRADDKEIKKPIARISIKRFMDRRGKSVAVTEETVYGQDVSGFKDAVKQWLKSKQGNVPPGVYQRCGGQWSDTFSKQFLALPTEKQDVIKWLHGAGNDAEYDVFFVEIDSTFIEYISGRYDEDEMGMRAENPEIENRSPEFFTKEDAVKWLDSQSWYGNYDVDDYAEYFKKQHVVEGFDEETAELDSDEASNPFEIRKRTQSHKSTMQSNAARAIMDAAPGEYPIEVIQEIKNMSFGSNTTSTDIQKALFEKYPQLFGREEKLGIAKKNGIDSLEKMPDGPERTELVSVLMDESNAILTSWAEDPNKMYGNYGYDIASDEIRVSLNFREKVESVLASKLTGPIKEPTIQLLDVMSDKLLEKLQTAQHLETTEDNVFPILSNMIHALAIKQADTPTAQRIYRKMLPYWGDDTKAIRIFDENGKNKKVTPINKFTGITMRNLGWAIGRLGANGREFLPFLQDRLEKEKTRLKEITEISAKNPKQGTNSDVIRRFKFNVETMLFIIDSIENGTGHSNRFRFRAKTHVNWYVSAKTHINEHLSNSPQDS